MTTPSIPTNAFSRVFSIEDTAGPENIPEYQGLWKAGAATWAQGDITRIRVPDPGRYDAFLTAGKIRGEQGTPQITIMARYTHDLSDMLALVRKGCESDIQIHMGLCQDPRDFNGGWDKILVLTKALPTNYSTDDLGAMMDSERAVINEEIPFSGEDLFEIKKLGFQEQATTQTVQEVVDIVVCDSISCGLCGVPSNGCDKVFALTMSFGASPGLPAEIIWTADGGGTWEDTTITTLAANEDPDAMDCVGTYLVVVSQESISLHYALIADILTSSETWVEVATGFVAAGAPVDIWSADPTHTWIVGLGGYIYFTGDVTAGVSVQTAGTVTTQPLRAIHGLDALTLVAVGDSNALLYTNNGGSTWSSITGPAVGVALNTVWMQSEREWWVGTAGGRLFYTLNAGTTWTEKAFSGSGAGVVRDIKFFNGTIGYMSHDTAAIVGRIFRTIDGGHSWYILPEGNGSIPVNDRINALAVCEDPNTVFGAGLGGNAIDGFIVKGN